jgi:hypothetical protein
MREVLGGIRITPFATASLVRDRRVVVTQSGVETVELD